MKSIGEKLSREELNDMMAEGRFESRFMKTGLRKALSASKF